MELTPNPAQMFWLQQKIKLKISKKMVWSGIFIQSHFILVASIFHSYFNYLQKCVHHFYSYYVFLLIFENIRITTKIHKV